eukprot:TRINITY_DN24762_c0_g1_i1.p3 TRINITY_DN24762_c0_g1~~TRINITY_DN24762_c0_g1_i1.p3  ORF type:complete len:116 (+),score=21.55 TRINITY_DN24762_c0_g1_i1:535-882(+)
MVGLMKVKGVCEKRVLKYKSCFIRTLIHMDHMGDYRSTEFAKWIKKVTMKLHMKRAALDTQKHKQHKIAAKILVNALKKQVKEYANKIIKTNQIEVNTHVPVSYTHLTLPTICSV